MVKDIRAMVKAIMIIFKVAIKAKDTIQSIRAIKNVKTLKAIKAVKAINIEGEY